MIHVSTIRTFQGWKLRSNLGEALNQIHHDFHGSQSDRSIHGFIYALPTGLNLAAVRFACQQHLGQSSGHEAKYTIARLAVLPKGTRIPRLNYCALILSHPWDRLTYVLKARSDIKSITAAILVGSRCIAL